MAHAQDAIGRLARRGERLRQEVVERLAAGVTLAKQCRLPSKLVVGHLCVRVAKRVHLVGDGPELAQLLVGAKGEDLGEDTGHGVPLRTIMRRATGDASRLTKG